MTLQRKLILIGAVILAYRAMNTFMVLRQRAEIPKEFLPAVRPTYDDYIRIMPWDNRYDGDTTEYWFGRGLGPATFQDCPEKRCFITNNQSNNDAVLISVNRLVKWYNNFNLPPRLGPQQKWIFFAWETPQHFPVKPEYMNTPLFNATFTYKKASDIYYPYGKIVERTDRWQLKYNDTWATKKNVAWISSHCSTVSGRIKYVNELTKHIDVTVMGKCSKVKCPGDNKLELPWAPCFKHIQQNYKFFLAFENSMCDEYVSEKLWRTLRMHMIPVVYGKPDYKSFLPKNSVIDVRDFPSPKHLAEYLKKVSSDPKLFASYFEWKHKHKSFQNTYPDAICDMCAYLHRTKYDPPKIVDLNKFWSVEHDCIPKEVFGKSIGIQ